MRVNDEFVDKGVEVQMEGTRRLDIGELELHREIVHLVAEEAELGSD